MVLDIGGWRRGRELGVGGIGEGNGTYQNDPHMKKTLDCKLAALASTM